MKRSSFYVVAGPILFISGFIAAKNIDAATELARVNGSVITLEEFSTRYSENKKFFQFRTPSKKEVLEDMIKRELGLQEARRLNLHKDATVVERMNTVLYHALLDKELSDEFEKIVISNEEAEGYYKKNPEIRTSHIFAGVAPGATKEQEAAAMKRIQEIKQKHLSDKTMSFAEVAQRYSEGMAAPMGGDLDYQTRDKLDPAYYSAALALKSPGKISNIVRTPYGFHIIKLTAVRPWAEVDKAKIKRLVFEEKRKEIFERYMSRLQAKAKVKINASLLK